MIMQDFVNKTLEKWTKFERQGSDLKYKREMCSEKLTLDLGKRSSEFGRPVKDLDNVGLRIRSGRKETLNIFLVEGHNFTFPTQVFADMSANTSQRPLDNRLPVKGEMLSLNYGEIE